MIDDQVYIRSTQLGKLVSFDFQCLGSPHEFDSGVPLRIGSTHGLKYHLIRDSEQEKAATKSYKSATFQSFHTDGNDLIFII